VTEMILETKALPDQIASFFATRQVRVRGSESELTLTPVADAEQIKAAEEFLAEFDRISIEAQDEEYDWEEFKSPWVSRKLIWFDGEEI